MLYYRWIQADGGSFQSCDMVRETRQKEKTLMHLTCVSMMVEVSTLLIYRSSSLPQSHVVFP